MKLSPVHAEGGFMRKVVPMLALLLLVGCKLADDPVVVNQTPALAQRAMWRGNLTGQTGFTAVGGTAEAADYGPYFNMQIAISNAAPATSYQWRIYPGTCAAPGATQFGPVQAYPNLVTGANGSAQLTRTISGPLDLTAAYNVRVSTVATPVRIVACGNLQS